MTFLIPVIVLSSLVSILIIEKWRLNRHRARIGLRIHVNGSRGKSSTTRLIAAALRGNQVKAIGKTTGTLPRIIFEDGHEEPIVRNGPTNINEQIKVFRWLARRKVDALVIECMALRPQYQLICEHEIVKSNIGVITNIRPDHLDVMGPTERDVALALGGTIPQKGILVTAERRHLDTLRECCEALQTKIIAVTAEDVAAVSDEEMNNFTYYEHKENVALAIKVAEAAGLNRELALQGMWAATPDPGALRAFNVEQAGADALFVNGFAANDPSSSELVWRIALNSFANARETRRCVLLNLRCDRVERTHQLAEAVSQWQWCDEVYIMGTAGELLPRLIEKYGFKLKIKADFGTMPAAQIYELLKSDITDKRKLVVGLGNVAGEGLNLVDAFAKNGQAIGCNQFVKNLSTTTTPASEVAAPVAAPALATT